MKTLKVEEVYLGGYETFDDAASRLPYFIENVYNAKDAFGACLRSSNEFESQLAQHAA